MTDQRTTDPPDHADKRDPPGGFVSLLSPTSSGEFGGDELDPRVSTDLRLDQVVAAAAGNLEDHDFVAGLLSRPVHEIRTLTHRQDVFRDLEDHELFDAVQTFGHQIRAVRAHIEQIESMRSAQQRAGWFLDAVVIYCRAVSSLGQKLGTLPVASRGLLAFRDYLTAYIASPHFTRLASEAADRRNELGKIAYLVRIKGPRVEVSKYDDEPDYSAEIERTFERFRQGAVQDHLIKYRGWPGMDHVGAHVLELVARLFRDEFGALDEFCHRHADFLDHKISQFGREIQFYLAYVDFIRPIRAAGLSFCLPEITSRSKEVFAFETFDLALAAKLIVAGKPVVPNDLELHDPERIIVVSGPNQGGKTTFARTFGQLHHLASIGCPVPGRAARLYLCDQIFTHFEREEDIADLTGKLEDDLLRIQKALQAATPGSIVIMNEIFTSTTLSDARFLGSKVLEKVADLDLLCVYVTFIDELASFNEKVVSMASTIVADDPAQRTYKVIRKPADGLAYALAIADKHRVTYEWLRRRITT